ncbi:hypothetical protein CVT24_012461 [Panaeolus cyanescens]|uniref:Uncharacterized protein n=1 Tax=Panaeolus cyanescens TaxID=181874 RepID=A0A409WKA7_9AGAR|nr:hypothetical protein CVT24_012461 [Panaeolus cyanescens]
MAQYFKALRFSTEEESGEDHVPVTLSSEIPLNRYLTVTPPMAEALERKQWALYPRNHKTAQLIIQCMKQNLDDRRDLRAIDLMLPKKEYYQYKLLFWDPVLQVMTPNGEPCECGHTLVFGEVHPVIAMLSAVEFFSGTYENSMRAAGLDKSVNPMRDPDDWRMITDTIVAFMDTFYPYYEDDEQIYEKFRRRAARRAAREAEAREEEEQEMPNAEKNPFN